MSLIQAKEICKIYSEEFSLNDISFEIEQKGIYGFLGKRGAGKSSLAGVLAGACAIDSGSLMYKEKALYFRDNQDAEIKKKIGYVPERSFFDGDLTVFELLDLTGKAKKVDPDKRFRQIKEALELTGLSNRSEVLIAQLELSEKKRLAIANALIGNPTVLILDEPLHHLDQRQAGEVKKLIDMLRDKKVVLVFSSSPKEIEEICGHIGILSNGSLVLWEDTEELLGKLSESRLGDLSDALDAFSEKEAE